MTQKNRQCTNWSKVLTVLTKLSMNRFNDDFIWGNFSLTSVASLETLERRVEFKRKKSFRVFD